MAGVVSKFNWGNDGGLGDLADSMRGFKDETTTAAENMRNNLLPGIEDARDKLNEFGDGAVAMGFLNDASLRLIDTIGEVGVTAEGATYGLDGIDLANIRASDSGKLLEDQVRNSIAAMGEEVAAAATTGESQDELTARYNASKDALVGQMVQMGLTEEEARALIDTVLETPVSKTTEFGSNAAAQQAVVQALADRVTTLPDGTVVIDADTSPAEGKIANLFRITSGAGAPGAYGNGLGVLKEATGGVVEFMAQGGLRGLTPMSSVAQVVPQDTWRVVGDRSDVPESFIPIDGSARSMSILLETMRRMGVMPMASGGITTSPGMGTPDRPATVTVEVVTVQNEDPRVLGRIVGREVRTALAGRA
jgi:hypothetical protein